MQQALLWMRSTRITAAFLMGALFLSVALLTAAPAPSSKAQNATVLGLTETASDMG